MAVKADELRAASRSGMLLNRRQQEVVSVSQETNHVLCHVFIP